MSGYNHGKMDVHCRGNYADILANMDAVIVAVKVTATVAVRLAEKLPRNKKKFTATLPHRGKQTNTL
jgi:hypothetical protein